MKVINSPGYLGQVQSGPGMSIAGDTQVYDPVYAARQKSEAEKAMRSQELTDMARQCEYMRQRMIALDLQDDADCMDGIIGHLMDRWNRERRR